MDFSFFKTDNKSGYKTKEKWIKANHPELYQDIILYCQKLDCEIQSFKEKIYFYFNKLTERPKCLTCGNYVQFRERFDKPYGEFCTLECFNKNKNEMSKRQKKSFNEKYGVDYYPKHPDFVIKQKETKKNKYDNPNYNNLEKQKKTKKIKYGEDYYNNHEKYVVTCSDKYGSNNFFSSELYKNQLETNFRKKYDDLNIEYIKADYVTIVCEKCKDPFKITKQLLYERNKINSEICVKCNPIGQKQRSSHEFEISNFLNLYGIKHSTSVRNIISKELDILIPDFNLSLEVNGLYWHSELFVSDDYHLNKTIECKNKGLSLLHIFEDEWLYKRPIVESIIKNKLNLINNKIFARNCQIKEVSSKESKIFLEKNHIQGNVNSKVKIGLYHEEKLVSLMTFSKGRVIMGGKDSEWELTRFCNQIDTVVVGGANKLFNFFIKTYNPSKIISYSDIRLFNGDLYNKLGFIEKGISKPNYWYVKNGIRYYRFNFRKNILVKNGFDPNKTEKEIMFDRKYYRIYDCGNIRWEYYLQ
jgi:hypothetical protein